jgi:putative flippase GtrA
MPLLPWRGDLMVASMSFSELLAAGGPSVGAMLASPPARFLAAGAVGLAADALAFSILLGVTETEWTSRLASLVLATLVTWRLNRRFTFATAARGAAPEALRYGLVAMMGQGFNYAQFVLLRTLAPALPPLLALFAAAATTALASYCGQRFFTFRPLEHPDVS